ncbi:DivIVA domain-containing protein [Micromonospora sp. NBC_01796]|uniref:DivIVA domain-containing protein n=1 Tax=Micromonospora sp. NBC_01796 TaxID=2975987 RepID=UPI002DDAF27B|nr:DivIVA domain-containing protein [Micromonospora sp. NBC_01796]WSA89102.1 DivIVA domain-containing protein [Micromonospora sp. NBC_01796]
MGQFLLLLVVALTAAAVVFGVTVLLTGTDPGLTPAEPDGRAVPLPASRPLAESDVSDVRFDTALRGYRMSQVDQAFARAAYDIGYKDELIGVLEAEVEALREGRGADADELRRARAAALATAAAGAAVAQNGSPAHRPEVGDPDGVIPADSGAGDPDAGTGDSGAAPAGSGTADTAPARTDIAPAQTDAATAETDSDGGSLRDATEEDAGARAESAGPGLRSERG